MIETNTRSVSYFKYVLLYSFISAYWKSNKNQGKTRHLESVEVNNPLILSYVLWSYPLKFVDSNFIHENVTSLFTAKSLYNTGVSDALNSYRESCITKRRLSWESLVSIRNKNEMHHIILISSRYTWNFRKFEGFISVVESHFWSFLLHSSFNIQEIPEILNIGYIIKNFN